MTYIQPPTPNKSAKTPANAPVTASAKIVAMLFFENHMTFIN